MAMDHDLILAGGGLANGLIAYRLAQLRPEVKVTIIEAGSTLGGNHTWSSFAHDLTPEQREWTRPFFRHYWDRYSIRFPDHGRTIEAGYGSIPSEAFAEELEKTLPPARILTNMPVVDLTSTSVTLADQSVLRAGCVIDARGQRPAKALDLRWQKFLGLEVELAEPHGLTGPVIMDATVPQYDGYRFVYTLPYGPKHVLIEDTYFSDGKDLAPQTLRDHLADYAASQGWTITRTIREEVGILPLGIGGDIKAFWHDDSVPKAGLRAGLFHPVTGYSFPDAVQVADLVASLPDLSAPRVFSALRAHSIRTWQSRGMYRILNRMLFLAAQDDERRTVLSRFYRHPDDLVSRFYAARPLFSDWMQILSGKPPIPAGRALKALLAYERSSR